WVGLPPVCAWSCPSAASESERRPCARSKSKPKETEPKRPPRREGAAGLPGGRSAGPYLHSDTIPTLKRPDVVRPLECTRIAGLFKADSPAHEVDARKLVPSHPFFVS